MKSLSVALFIEVKPREAVVIAAAADCVFLLYCIDCLSSLPPPPLPAPHLSVFKRHQYYAVFIYYKCVCQC